MVRSSRMGSGTSILRRSVVYLDGGVIREPLNSATTSPVAGHLVLDVVVRLFITISTPERHTTRSGTDRSAAPNASSSE